MSAERDRCVSECRDRRVLEAAGVSVSTEASPWRPHPPTSSSAPALPVSRHASDPSSLLRNQLCHSQRPVSTEVLLVLSSLQQRKKLGRQNQPYAQNYEVLKL